MADPIALYTWPELALWLCPLHEVPVAARQAWLDAEEVERARKFAHDVHRRRYLAAHVALRERLAGSLGMAPSALSFASGPHGKPQLAGRATVQFNLSHSEDWALVGVGRAGPVGVDIEVLRSVDDALALARKHYTPNERAACESAVDVHARDRAFLRVWTRKEACLKAVGLGLRLAPSSFEAGPQGARHVARLATPEGEALVEVQSVETGIDAVAAVARRVG